MEKWVLRTPWSIALPMKIRICFKTKSATYPLDINY